MKDLEFLLMFIKISNLIYYIGASNTICSQNQLDNLLGVYTILP